MGQLQLGQSILRVMKVNSEVAEKMSVRVTVSCKAESVRFSERLLVVEPGDFVAVGRADTNNRSDLENGYFNCKVGCQETDCMLTQTYLQVVFLFRFSLRNMPRSSIREIKCSCKTWAAPTELT